MSEQKNRILKKLKVKKHREAFVNQTINVGIPFQIRALREQRQLTQQDFEEKSGMKQSQISRYEDPNYCGFSLKTLKRIAFTYDIGLVVRFVPISDLVKYELELNLDSTKSLNALSYEDDPYFETPAKEVDVTLSDTLGTTICPSENQKKIL